MKYREILLRGVSADKIKTEIMYEVAAAHIAGVELLKVNISKGDCDTQYKKTFSALIRILKLMKADGTIQFFATPALLESQSTEAEFLLNKYPEHFEPMPKESDELGFVYIRA